MKLKKIIRKVLTFIFMYLLVFVYCFMLSDSIERLEEKENYTNSYEIMTKITK